MWGNRVDKEIIIHAIIYSVCYYTGLFTYVF